MSALDCFYGQWAHTQILTSCARPAGEWAGCPDSKKGPPKKPSAPWKRMRCCAPRAPPGQSDPLPMPAHVNPPGATGSRDKRKSEVKISLEAGAKFQALFSLILLAWKLTFQVKASFLKLPLWPPWPRAAEPLPASQPSLGAV